MKALIGQSPNLPWYKVREMSDEQIKEFNSKYLMGIEMTDAFITTPEGAHAKAKELGIKAYNLGCSCYNCNKEFDEIIKELRVGKQEESVLYKEIWNKSIEAVIKLTEERWFINLPTKEIDAIRRLKK